jgi:hypothetical protein
MMMLLGGAAVAAAGETEALRGQVALLQAHLQAQLALVSSLALQAGAMTPPPPMAPPPPPPPAPAVAAAADAKRTRVLQSLASSGSVRTRAV